MPHFLRITFPHGCLWTFHELCDSKNCVLFTIWSPPLSTEPGTKQELGKNVFTQQFYKAGLQIAITFRRASLLSALSLCSVPGTVLDVLALTTVGKDWVPLQAYLETQLVLSAISSQKISTRFHICVHYTYTYMSDVPNVYRWIYLSYPEVCTHRKSVPGWQGKRRKQEQSDDLQQA